MAYADKGVSLAPNDLDLLDTRGTILANLPERWGDARKDFEKLVGLSSPQTRVRAAALLQLGRVCVKLDDLAQAKQYFQQALEIDGKTGIFTADERAEIQGILQGSVSELK